MYEKHFGLRCRPFRPTPDSDSYYPATTHEQALERLAQGIQADEGHLLLTGIPGTGKTLLGHRLLDRLGPQTACAFLTNTHQSDRAGLLQAILYELALPYADRSEQEMRLALTDFLLENFKAGRRALLLVDEAHHLTSDLLEELRLLGNLEASHSKALQVVLLAQPSIHATLHHPDLAALGQRVAVRAIIEPLGQDEAADYLVHHLRLAGARPEAIITDEALTLLAQGGQGIPRLLNQSAHQALLLAHAAGERQVDVEAALEALNLLGLATESVMPPSAEPAALVDAETDPPDHHAKYEELMDEEAGDVRPIAALPREDPAVRHVFISPRRPA
jgi:type II secretory pathway predicted ATPase ExeA